MRVDPYSSHLSNTVLVRRVVSGIVIGSLCVLAAGPRAGYAFPVAKLRGVRPVVETRTGKKRWSVARERGALVFGDHVRTGPRGSAQLVFGNGTRLDLRSNTEIEIREPESPEKPLVVRLVTALSEVFVRNRGRVQIRTAAGIAASGSTEYSVRLDSDIQTTVTVAEGHVTFFNPQGSVDLTDNEQATARVGSAPTRAVRVDATGLLAWTGDVGGFALPFELPVSPGDSAGLANAKTLLQGGNGQSAEDAFKAERGSAQPDEALAGVALSQLSQGARDGARETVANATTPLATGVRALLLIEAGDARGAQALLEPLATAPDTPFQIHTLLALSQLQNAEIPAANRAATRATELAPNSAGALATLALTQFFSRANDRNAGRNARRAVELDPLSPLALLAVGRVEAARGNLEEARQALEQAAGLSPDLPGIQRDLGDLELVLDRLPRAERALRASLAAEPDNARALASLGTVLSRRGDIAGARENLDRAVVLSPNDPIVRANRAAFLVERGELEAAASEDAFLLERQDDEPGTTKTADDPALGALFIRLSEAALFQQQLTLALNYAREAVRLLPDSAPARYQQARVFLEQGRITQAQQGFQLALVLDPNFASARYALGLVREGQQFAGSGRITGQVAAAIEAAQSRTSSPRNLASVGLSERIQAVLQDPTVFRTASRSFGDVQIDGSYGESGTNYSSFSFARELNNRRSAIGLNVSRDEFVGVRPSATQYQQDATIQFGQKSSSDSSGIWGQLSWQRIQPSYDTKAAPDPLRGVQNNNIEKPSVFVGGKIGNRNAQTRFLVDADRNHIYSELYESLFDVDYRSLHGEIRHDRRFNQNFSLILGGSMGHRGSDDYYDSGPIPVPGGPIRLFTDGVLNFNTRTAYARVVWTPNSRWRIEPEMRYRSVSQSSDSTTITVPTSPESPPFISTAQGKASAGLPGFVALYRPSPTTTVRLRSRRTLGTIEEFDLLAPTDLFLVSLQRENLLPNIFARGRSHELELSHTFSNSSFVRFNAFRYSNGPSSSPLSAEVFEQSRLQGIETEYNTLLTHQLTLAVRARWFDGRGQPFQQPRAPLTSLAGHPKFDSEIDLQYLDKKGFFAQVTQAYIAGRREALGFGETVAQRSGGFGLTGVRVGKRFGLRSTLFLEASNIFDKQYSVTADGSNDVQSGRRFRIGASLRF